MNRGVLLYGPPAAGKSTLTRALAERAGFVPFRPLKAGDIAGGTPPRGEYRPGTQDAFDELAARGELVWEARRYGARYAFDHAELARLLAYGGCPVVSLGDPEAVDSIRRCTRPATWLAVELWCDIETAARRLIGRGDRKRTERLERWRATPRLASADLTFDTTHTGPEEAADSIRRRLAAIRP
ncbi:MAG: phosphotransferase-like protein [Nocardioides sp.]